MCPSPSVKLIWMFHSELNKNCFQPSAIHSSSTFIHKYDKYTFLVYSNSERNLSGVEQKYQEKKRSFRFDSFKILFLCVCEKWSVIFVISKFFLLADVLKRSAIADKHPLFATLLTPPMLITAFLHFWHEGHWEPCNDVGSLSPAKLLMGFELGMF